MKPLTKGVNHIGLTVSNLEESAGFFTDLLGWKVVKRRSDYPAIFVSDGYIMITLWLEKSKNFIPFDRKSNIGLHHLAIEVESDEMLSLVYNTIKNAMIEIESGPTVIDSAKHFFCIEPSGIRVEFYYSFD